MEEEKKPKKRNLGAVITFIIASGVSTYFINHNKHDNYADLQDIAKEMNKSCPKKIDSDTRLDSCAPARDPLMMTYYYTAVNIDLDSVTLDNKVLTKELSEPTQANLDTARVMEPFRKANVSLTYVYKDNKGKPIVDYTIKPTKKQ